jgi:hypothetical protein
VWSRSLPLVTGTVLGAVIVALLGASFDTHSWPSTVMVSIPAVLALAVVARRPGSAVESVEGSARLRRSVLLWSVLAGAVLLWEAYAFVRQPDWSAADQAYPTLSTLLDPILEHGPLRVVGWLVWLGVGWRLVAAR